MKKTIDLIKEKYGTDTPITWEELRSLGNPEISLRVLISKAVSTGEIKCATRGVYYFPTQTEWGESSISKREIEEKKYLTQGEDKIGYYTGMAFKNSLSISTQIPSVVEIVTNKESSRKRETKIGKFKVILRKPRIPVTKDNIDILPLLDMINTEDRDFLNKHTSEIKDYCQSKDISFNDVLKYVEYYPTSVSQKILQRGFRNVFIQ